MAIDSQIQTRLFQEIVVHAFPHGHGLFDGDSPRWARRFAISTAEARLLVHHCLAVACAELQCVLRADSFCAFLAPDARIVIDGSREPRRREPTANVARG